MRIWLSRCFIAASVLCFSLLKDLQPGLGRVPVEDCLAFCHERWEERGFLVHGGRLTVGTWVDNVFSLASTAYRAIELLDDLEVAFKERWSLKYGQDSKLFLTVKGAAEGQLEGWKRCEGMPMLGHILSYDGSTAACWKATKKALWSSFWVNAGALERCVSLDKKLILLRRCT